MKQLFSLLCLMILSVVALVGVSSVQAQSTSLPSFSFNPSSMTAQENDIFSTQVVLDTSGQAAQGGGAKITFNPAILRVLDIKPGTMFADYPVAAFDNQTGQVTISGIVSGPGQSFVGRGAFATITWKLIQSQNALVNFHFTPGATDDSNIAVTTGNGDILQQVGTLSITPGVMNAQPIASSDPSTLMLQSTPVAENQIGDDTGFMAFLRQYLTESQLWGGNLLKKLKELFPFFLTESQVDPYAPITAMPSKTSLGTQDSAINPAATVSQVGQNSSLLLVISVVALIVVALLGIWWWRRSRPTTVIDTTYKPPGIKPPPGRTF